MYTYLTFINELKPHVIDRKQINFSNITTKLTL